MEILKAVNILLIKSKNDVPPRLKPQGRKSLMAVKNFQFLMSSCFNVRNINKKI